MCTVCPIIHCIGGGNELAECHAQAATTTTTEINNNNSNNNSCHKSRTLSTSETMLSAGHNWDSGGSVGVGLVHLQQDEECEEEETKTWSASRLENRVSNEANSSQNSSPPQSYRRRRNFYHNRCSVSTTTTATATTTTATSLGVPKKSGTEVGQQPSPKTTKSNNCSLPSPTSILNVLVSVHVRRKGGRFADRRLNLLCTLLPTLIAISVFSNSIFGDFVHDDLAAIVRNPDVNGDNNWTELFSNDFWGVPMSSVHSHKSYRPITVLLFRLNYSTCKGHSWCFHGTNVLLHGCATFLLSHVCLRLLNMDILSTLVAATLFAVHPIHTEAVSGLVGCADLLACNFTLLSFLTYTRYLKNPKDLKCHLGSLVAASLAVLSKETGIMALAINISYGAAHMTFYRPRPGRKTSSSRKIAFKRISTDAFMLGFLLVCRLMLQKSSMLPYFSAQDNPAAFHSSAFARMSTFLYLPALNFWLLLCPSWLSYDWQMGSVPLLTSIWDIRWIPIAVFYGTLVLLTLQAFRKLRVASGPTTATTTSISTSPSSSTTTTTTTSNFLSNKLIIGSKLRTLIAAILFLVLPFLPASNLFFHVGFVLAERILYLPSVGFCLLVALGLSTVLPRLSPIQRRRHIPRLLLRKQQQQHSNIPVTSSSYRRLTKCRRQRLDSCSSRDSSVTDSSEDGCEITTQQQKQQLRQQPTIVVSPQLILTLSILVIVLALFSTKTWIKNQDWLSRASLFRSGLKTVPANAKVHYNYANVLKEEGKLKMAAKHYKEALRLWPGYVMAHNNLATLLTDKAAAELHLRRALNIDPWHANSLYNLAVLLSERGLCFEAVPLLEKCLSEDPTHERALLLLSDCLLATSGRTRREESNKTAKKKNKLKKNFPIESEIKTILEMEEKEEEERTTRDFFLSKMRKEEKNKLENNFFSSQQQQQQQQHRHQQQQQQQQQHRVTSSGSSRAPHRSVNENLTGNGFPANARSVTSYSAKPVVGRLFQDEDDASKSNGKGSDVEMLLSTTKPKFFELEDEDLESGDHRRTGQDHDSQFHPRRMASFLSHLAEVYIGVGHWSKAEGVLKRLLSVQPLHQVALYQLSQVYLEQNETVSALTVIRAAKEQCGNKNPERSSSPGPGSGPTSDESYRPCLWGGRCIPREQICTGILIQEADILREMGFFKLAAKNYRLALEESPSEPHLLLSLGSVHHAMGEWENAWIHYHRCLQIQPDNKILIANMELLAKSVDKNIVLF